MRNQRGFSLLEIIFVMSIIGILTVMNHSRQVDVKKKQNKGVTIMPSEGENNPDFKKYVALYEELKKASENSIIHLTMADRELHPQILGYDEKQKMVFVALSYNQSYFSDGKGNRLYNRIYFNGKTAALFCAICDFPSLEGGRIKKVADEYKKTEIYSAE